MDARERKLERLNQQQTYIIRNYCNTIGCKERPLNRSPDPMEDWKLTEEEQGGLTTEQLSKYDRAVAYKKHDWAMGPYGGWARGNDLLKELGWEEKKRHEGHRCFVSLIKPDKQE